MKKTNKKVIVITIVIISVAMYMFFYVTQLGDSVEADNPNEYVGHKNIDLPNGSTSTIEIANTQNAAQSWIGASLSELSTSIKDNLHYVDQDGVYIQDTLRDSPAQIAGLLPGDILIKINETDTVEVLSALKLIASLQPGTTYAFTIFRQGEYLNYTVTPKQHFS